MGIGRIDASRDAAYLQDDFEHASVRAMRAPNTSLQASQLASTPLSGIVLCGLGLASLVAIVETVLTTSRLFPFIVMAAYCAGAVCLLACAARYLRSERFGLANLITLTRWALAALLIGALAEDRSDRLLWYCVVVATIALVLDGFDGYVARRAGESTAFGARFDMETDAAIMLVLCILVWYFDRAGVWILAAGLMRYAFVAASWLAPRMRRALPPSTRRKTACVVQLIALVAALAPLFSPAGAQILAGAGLLLLTASFATDVSWLARQE